MQASQIIFAERSRLRRDREKGRGTAAQLVQRAIADRYFPCPPAKGRAPTLICDRGPGVTTLLAPSRSTSRDGRA
jgi:hypothetical protein